ncbi:GspH/FimT family pseudopilin [Rhodoferax sp. WC2427]|uniref:GspH/FimT family pseudopilin n=1 Tax=Rhodoferax sp. WC2427 TaxID=3234144 RepID=UPI003465C1DA
MFVNSPFVRQPRLRGFTLIELLVAMAILGVLAALAAPSLRTFIVRNTFSTIGNEFSSSVLRARNEAVSKNMCVTMCMSTTVDTTTGNGPTCVTSGQDWQVGWIVFLNPECNASIDRPRETNAAGNLVNAPENMLLVRRQGKTDYSLMSQSSTQKILFNPRGNATLSAAGRFDLTYTDNTLSNAYASSICLDKMGRTRPVPAAATCNTY